MRKCKHLLRLLIGSTTTVAVIGMLLVSWGLYHKAWASGSIHLENVPYVVQKERLD